jgi:putative addiction module killer protein
MYKIHIYKTANDKEPYTEWLQNLDSSTRAKINARITRIRDTGNLGVYEPIEDGVFEIKIYLGPGSRCS